MSVRACILGLEGTSLTAAERAFFADVKPWGYILFRRNVETPAQVRELTASLREISGRDNVPILIDQEGGRVQRLGPPHWRRYPPGSAFGRISANDPLVGREITRLGARLMAHDLKALGINVDCVPVLDVPTPGAHDIIGDRAYGDTPDKVGTLARAAAEGLLAGGVLPVIKHIPGHGRAGADSHEALPVVDASLHDLDAHDFEPFRILSDMPLGMTAHVVYTALARKHPATTSRKVISQIIRKSIGFDGLLMSDDLSMKALSGDFADRTRQSLRAGCDVVLHCNGNMAEMDAIAGASPALKGEARRRAAAALGRISRSVEPLDVDWAHARLNAALEGVWPEAMRPEGVRA